MALYRLLLSSQLFKYHPFQGSGVGVEYSCSRTSLHIIEKNCIPSTTLPLDRWLLTEKAPAIFSSRSLKAVKIHSRDEVESLL